MNLKSSAKKSGFTIRTKGASKRACQYKHFLNALFSYSEDGQSSRWQKSNWNCCLVTGGQYQFMEQQCKHGKNRNEGLRLLLSAATRESGMGLWNPAIGCKTSGGENDPD